jgi:hypothetical protein
VEAQVVMTVSAAVVALVQFIKWSGLRDGYAPYAVAVTSALGVALWAWDNQVPLSGNAFKLFAGWVSVTLSAAGVFGFVRSMPETVAAMRQEPSRVQLKETIQNLRQHGGPTMALLMATSLFLSGCATATVKQSAGNVGKVGITLAETVGHLQKATSDLEAVGTLKTVDAIKVHERLLVVNKYVAELAPVLRDIDAVNDPTAADLDRALKILTVISTRLSTLLAGVVVEGEATKLLEVVAAAQNLAITIAVQLGRLQEV